MKKIIFLILMLLITVVISVNLAGAQQGVEAVLANLRATGKLHGPDKIFSDFIDGKDETAVIVLLQPSAEAKVLAGQSRLSAQVPAQFSAQGAPTYYNFRDNSVRRQLKATVTETVDRFIDQLGATGIKVTQKFSYQFGFAALVTSAALERIVNWPDVVAVEKDSILQAHLAQGIPLMNALNVHSSYRGSGLSIAICDTGIDTFHPKLGGGGFPNSKVIGGYDTGDNDADPRPNSTLGNPHGTACAGIAAGDTGTVGDYIGGVASDAKLYAVKISTGNTGSASSAAMIAGWEWVITHQNDDPSNPIMIISTSFGGGRYFSTCDLEVTAMTTAAANAVAAGITIFASSGNDGYCDSVAWPACISFVNSVGAVYDAPFGDFFPCLSSASCASKIPTGGCATGYYAIDHSAADKVTSYSNSASFLTLFASSNNAYTTDIVGAGGYSSGDYYASFGGTSAACPYAAGAAAVLQQAAKAKTGSFLTPAQVKTYLVNNGDLITDGKVAITKPRINLGRAVDALTSSITAPTVTTNAATGVTATGATLNGTVNANNGSTTVTFEYGTTMSYGSTVTADPNPVTGASDIAVSKAITGLTPNTIYHFRVMGSNSAGTTNGGDLTFTTNDILSLVVTPTLSSGKFDGSGDYLAVPSGFNFGTGDFTIDTRVRLSAQVPDNTHSVLYSQYDSDSNFIFVSLYKHSGTGTIFPHVHGYRNGINFNINTNLGTNLLVDTWYHIEISRENGVISFFLDGIKKPINASKNPETDLIFEGEVHIGAENSRFYLNGYLDEFRISKGLARHNASFTPSATIGTADAYTELLLHFDGEEASTIITDSSAAARPVTAKGDAKISRSVYPLLYLPVNEGESNSNITVRLNAQPPGNTAVTVSRTAGDADLNVTSGASLTFTPANWSVPQTVTLSAAQDADYTNGTATFTVDSTGLASQTVLAMEVDDDVAPPTIMTISPTSGTTAGGTSVTITGTNLTGTSGVTFGGTAATSVAVVNGTTVTCATPAKTAGAVNVVLTTPGGTATSTNGYSYVAPLPTIATISPTSGTTAGGTSVTITGTNLTGTSGVTFGGTAATSVAVVNGTTVTCATPAKTAGAVNVVLTTPGGTATSTNGYTYVAPPTVTTGPAANVTKHSATLKGTVNPNGLSTTYYFEWGTTTAYGNKSPSTPASAGDGWDNVVVSANLTGLTFNTNYHYRLVATNSVGTTYGSDTTFRASINPMPWLMLLMGD